MVENGWHDGVFYANGAPSLGRPPTFRLNDQNTLILPTHEAYAACREPRQMAVFHRRGRKTGTTLEKVFKWLYANPGSVGKTLAPFRKQAKEIIWDDPSMLFHPNVLPPSIIKKINKSDLSITLINGSYWSLDGADDPQKKRGSNVKVLHLTEAGDHQEEVWNQIYEPILTANGGVAFFEGNPRGQNWYNRLFEAAATRPGWARFLLSAKDSPIFTPEELEDLRKNTPDAVFRAEYLCEWIASIGTVFRSFHECATSVQIDAAVKGRKYRISIDLAKNQDYTVITVIDRHTWDEVFKDRFNQVDWVTIKERIKHVVKSFSSRENENEAEIVIEANGVGDPIFDDMWHWSVESEVTKLYKLQFIPWTTTNASKAMLVSNLSMLFDQRFIKILPDETTLKELGQFTYTKTPTGFIYKAPEGVGNHDDTVMSMAIGYWNLGAKLPVPQEKIEVTHKWGIPVEKYNQARRVQEVLGRLNGLG